MHRAVSPCALIALLAGCSGEAPAEGPDMAVRVADLGPDLAAPPPDLQLPNRAPTDHPALPQMSWHGGPVIKAMEIWTVVWPGEEALGARVDRFHAWMLKSDYWTKSLAEYKVGAGTAKGVIVLPGAAPGMLDVSAFDGLAQMVARDHPPNANSVFAFVVPLTTQVSGGPGENGCLNYGGYHSQTVGGISYEVNLQCAGQGNGAFDDLTYVLSHEAAETATDARPFTNPAWFDDDYASLGEIGDLCVGLSASLPSGNPPVDGGPSDDTYYVTRLWSNKAAAAGNADPCVPAPADAIYFNVAVDPTVITITTDKQGRGSQAIRFEPYSFGDVGMIHWQLTAGIPGVSITPGKGGGPAGSTFPGLITVTPQAQQGSYVFALTAQSQKGGANQWFASLTIQ
jgi:hypothetical protein